MRVNPDTLEGLELLVAVRGEIAKHERQFDPSIFEDFEYDKFEKSSPMEFNLHLASV